MLAMLRCWLTCSNIERISNQTEFLKFENLPDVKEQLTEGFWFLERHFSGLQEHIIFSVKLTEFAFKNGTLKFGNLSGK